jgi:hypothetical protein
MPAKMSIMDKYSEDKEPLPTEKKMEKILKCPDCGAEGDDIGYENEEHFCKKCGAVIEWASDIDQG